MYEGWFLVLLALSSTVEHVSVGAAGTGIIKNEVVQSMVVIPRPYWSKEACEDAGKEMEPRLAFKCVRTIDSSKSRY